MAVVGNDPPEHGVVAVSEAAPERHDEDSAPRHPRFPRQYGAVAVADGLHAPPHADVVVEDEPDRGRSGSQHGAIPGDGADESGMGPTRRREDQGAEQSHEEGAGAQRFENAS